MNDGGGEFAIGLVVGLLIMLVIMIFSAVPKNHLPTIAGERAERLRCSADEVIGFLPDPPYHLGCIPKDG